MDRKEREARRRQEDAALNRGLMWVGVAIILEALLLLVNRYYINFLVSQVDLAYTVRGLVVAARIGGAVVGVAALVWALFQYRKGGKAALPLAVGLVALTVALCGHVTLAFQRPGMQMLLVLVPALAGLALVFYLYQREFFPAAAAVGLSVVGLWFVRFGGMVEAVVTLLVIAAITGVVFWLKKNGGVYAGKEEQKFRVLSKKTNYSVLLASCVASVVAVAAAMVLGANVAYYLLFAMLVWLFGLLVYYTVKLM